MLFTFKFSTILFIIILSISTFIFLGKKRGEKKELIKSILTAKISHKKLQTVQKSVKARFWVL